PFPPASPPPRKPTGLTVSGGKGPPNDSRNENQLTYQSFDNIHYHPGEHSNQSSHLPGHTPNGVTTRSYLVVGNGSGVSPSFSSLNALGKAADVGRMPNFQPCSSSTPSHPHHSHQSHHNHNRNSPATEKENRREAAYTTTLSFGLSPGSYSSTNTSSGIRLTYDSQMSDGDPDENSSLVNHYSSSSPDSFASSNRRNGHHSSCSNGNTSHFSDNSFHGEESIACEKLLEMKRKQ
ncbi:unnamed protein product, partial [Allacma fusca]